MQHHPRIIEYHAATTLRATEDEVPWCSSFVNWCMMKAGYTGTRSAAARSWLGWGTPIQKPVRGCVVILTRTGGGHVGFLDKIEDGTVYLLGGNQDNEVNFRGYHATRIMGYRLPAKMSMDDEAIYNLLKELQ